MQQVIDTEVAVIGGSTAGLSVALTLGRSGRETIVFDTGTPRNKPARHAHNIFTRDGTPPLELLRIGREQLQPYPSVSFREMAITSVVAENGAFLLQSSQGETFRARRVIIATGVRDQLPDIPGIAGLWGNKVIHCPYCHGWEVKGEPVAILGNGELAYESAAMLSNWHKDITICTGGAPEFTPEQEQHLQRNGINVLPSPIQKIEDIPGGITITLTDGTALRKGAAYIRASKLDFQNELAIQLGCELSERGAIKVNGFFATTVPGVFAAGDVASDGHHQVAMGAAGGHTAGAACNNGLAKESFERT